MVEILLTTLIAGSIIAGLGVASMRAEARKKMTEKRKATVGPINAVTNQIGSSPASNNASGDWASSMANQELAASTITTGK